MRKEKVTSRNYRGGRIIAFIGGCELDLTQARGGPACSWRSSPSRAASKSKCPKGGEVIGNTPPIMGGADIRTKAAPGERRKIEKIVMMGGVDTKSKPAEAL